jgi:3-hydroxyisobutyrate dehydrogenase
MQMTSPRIGFIGLGRMGSGIALNLRKGGYEVTVLDADKSAASEHLSAGCTWGGDAAQLAEAADVVFTSLPSPGIVEEVATGERGLLLGLRPGTAWFDLSTNAPATIRRMHDVFAPGGVAVLDAPVSGGPEGARTGNLTVWVGGEPEVYARFEIVFDAISNNHRLVGPIGSATVAKLVHNAAGYGINLVLAEVFTAGVAAGVPPLELWAAIRDGGLGKIRTFDGLARHFLPQSFDPPAFALALAHKDVGLMADLGRQNSVPLRMIDATLGEMTEAINRGWAGRDSRVAMMVQVERSGVDPEAMRCDPDDIAQVLKNG